MAENAKIAALRKGMAPGSGASGSGPQALNFAWMNAPSVASAPFQFRPVGKLKNPPKQTMEVVPPVNPLDLLSRNLNRQMDFYNPYSGLPNPVAVSMQKIIDNYTPPENPENAWTNFITEDPATPYNGDVMRSAIDDTPAMGQVVPQYDDTSYAILLPDGEVADVRSLSPEQDVQVQEQIIAPLQEAGIAPDVDTVAAIEELLTYAPEPAPVESYFVPGYTPDPTPLPPEPIKPGSQPAEAPTPAPVAAPPPAPPPAEPEPMPTELQLAQAYEGLYPMLTAPAPEPTPAPVVALAPEPAPLPPAPEPVAEATPDLRTLIAQLVEAEPVYTPPAPAPALAPAPEPPPPPPPEPVYVAPPPPAPAPEPVVEPAPIAVEEPVVDPYIEQILALYEQLYAPVDKPTQEDPFSVYPYLMLEEV